MQACVFFVSSGALIANSKGIGRLTEQHIYAIHISAQVLMGRQVLFQCAVQCFAHKSYQQENVLIRQYEGCTNTSTGADTEYLHKYLYCLKCRDTDPYRQGLR